MKEKRIIFNGRFLSQSITGVQRYAYELLKSIDDMLENTNTPINFEVLIPKNVVDPPKFNNIEVRKVGKLTGHLWEQIELPLYTKGILLINLCNISPLLKFNQICTIHDAAVFATDQYKFLFRIWYKTIYHSNRWKNNRIITVSDFSKRELVKYCGFPDEAINVIYEGRNHMLDIKEDDSILQENQLTKGNYVLAVSSMSPNKNFKNIMNALEKIDDPDIEFVICGGTNPKVFSNLEIEKNKKLKYLGYVSDSQLKSLYKNAGCFLYPSFYEGFGLPPLEAITCGCPIILSNTSSLPEIFSNSAEYCDPNDASEIAEKILLLMHDSNLNRNSRNYAMDYSQKFDWKNTALQSLKIYNS